MSNHAPLEQVERAAFDAWFPLGCPVAGVAAQMAALAGFRAGAEWQRARPAEAEGLAVRSVQTREGYDVWDKLCAIPRYGFIRSPDNSRILKAAGIGNWIDRDDAMRVVDDAQSELNLARAALSAVTAERNRLREQNEQQKARPEQALTEALGERLMQSSAENYIETTFGVDGTDEDIVVTLRRSAGKTPHELRLEAEAERDQLRAEIAALRKDAEQYVPVHEAIQQAAGELPNGWEIRLCVERDGGGVELYGPEGTAEQFASDHERLDYTVTDALEAALAAQGGAA